MGKKARLAKKEDFIFIYHTLKESLAEQEVLHRFQLSQEAFYDAIFGEQPISTILILFLDDQPVGLANYSMDHRNFTVNHLPNLYLNDFYIKQPYRRQGCASFLFFTLIEIAKQKNCGRIEWVVLPENKPAINFYKKFHAVNMSNSLQHMRLAITF